MVSKDSRIERLARIVIELDDRLKEAEKVIDYYATEENYNFAKDILLEARDYLEKYQIDTKDSTNFTGE